VARCGCGSARRWAARGDSGGISVAVLSEGGHAGVPCKVVYHV
jgi:hypothetical protein